MTIKKALITGCGRGIGAAVAKEIAAHAIELVAINRSKAPMEQLMAELGDSVKITPYYQDVTEFEQLDQLLDTVFAEHPDIDLVVLNAGLDLPQQIESFDWRIAKLQIDTNLTANYVVAAKLLPYMLARVPAGWRLSPVPVALPAVPMSMPITPVRPVPA